MKTRTTIINLFGGPGVGKSTIASGIFHNLKSNRISCELVTEFAKEISWEETHKLLENQIHIFAEQFRRQWRLIDKVDYVITDSPLLLNSIYFDYYLEKLGPKVRFTESYIDLSRSFFDSSFLQFNNVNFFIKRAHDFDPSGRNQDEHESIDIDQQIMNKLLQHNQEFMIYSGDTRDIVQSIVSHLIRVKEVHGN